MSVEPFVRIWSHPTQPQVSEDGFRTLDIDLLPTPKCKPEEHFKQGGGCYYCCDSCNYDKHICHFCGDGLRHDGSRYQDPVGTSNPCYIDG